MNESSEKTEFLAEVMGNSKSKPAKKTRFLTFCSEVMNSR